MGISAIFLIKHSFSNWLNSNCIRTNCIICWLSVGGAWVAIICSFTWLSMSSSCSELPTKLKCWACQNYTVLNIGCAINTSLEISNQQGWDLQVESKVPWFSCITYPDDPSAIAREERNCICQAKFQACLLSQYLLSLPFRVKTHCDAPQNSPKFVSLHSSWVMWNPIETIPCVVL